MKVTQISVYHIPLNPNCEFCLSICHSINMEGHFRTIKLHPARQINQSLSLCESMHKIKVLSYVRTLSRAH